MKLSHARVVLSALVHIALLSALLPQTALARDTELSLPLAAAVESDHGKAHLLEIPVYLRGQPHPEVEERLAEIDTSRATRGAFRGDEASCNVAVLSALRVLQEVAHRKGGDAVVDIVSITRKKMTESPSHFRCVAGNIIVHVGLRGTVVRMGAQAGTTSAPAH